MFGAFPDCDPPVAAPQKQNLTNEVLKHLHNVLFRELVVPPSQLGYQEHQYLHLYYPRKKHEKLHSDVLHAGALWMDYLRAVYRSGGASESCCDVIKGRF